MNRAEKNFRHPVGLISVEQVAERLGVSTATIWRWARGHTDFPRPIRLSPGCTRWQEADLETWLSGITD
jgi:prophage regulatory protein